MFKIKGIYLWLVILIVIAIILSACGDVNTPIPLSAPAGHVPTQTPPVLQDATAAISNNPSGGSDTPIPLLKSNPGTTISPNQPQPSPTQVPATVVVTNASPHPSTSSTADTSATPETTSTIGLTSSAPVTPYGSPASQFVTPHFVTAPDCPYNLPAGQILNQTVLCGYVSVPETHANSASGKTLKIAVLVFKSKAANPAEPIIYLEGGPSGHIQSIVDFMTGDFYQAFIARGDAIFFDQRGVGNSQPALYCPEIEAQVEKGRLHYPYSCR